MNNSNLTFKSILIFGLKKGITYSSIFAFITTGWFVFLWILDANVSTFGIIPPTVLLAGFISVIITIPGFIFVGFPLMITPAVLGSFILTYLLYQDFKKTKISLRKSRINGVLVGCVLGFMPILLLTIKNNVQGSNSSPNLDDFYGFVYIVVFLVFPILFGGIAGYLLGTSLFKELIKNSKLPESKDNLTPDT